MSALCIPRYSKWHMSSEGHVGVTGSMAEVVATSSMVRPASESLDVNLRAPVRSPCADSSVQGVVTVAMEHTPNGGEEETLEWRRPGATAHVERVDPTPSAARQRGVAPASPGESDAGCGSLAKRMPRRETIEANEQ